jgi:alkanesulfonate monooxygenase SsuD/methylene tetrahydromethanopterin reductase-like flavin-dependent oxidoreductase (luciferase family)
MMHLAIQAAAPGHPAGWRLPGGKRQANEDVAHYQNVARICERALLDVLFLADSPSFPDDGRSPTRSLLDGAQFKQRSAGVSSGHRAARSRLLQDRSVTVRQIVARGGGGHYRFVGTPEQIVDFMEK